MFSWFKRPSGNFGDLRMEFIAVRPGSFWMGQGEGEPDPDGAAPLYQVTLTRPYKIATTTVTRDQFAQFVKATDYYTSAEKKGVGVVYWKSVRGASWLTQQLASNEALPMTYASWDDAI